MLFDGRRLSSLSSLTPLASVRRGYRVLEGNMICILDELGIVTNGKLWLRATDTEVGGDIARLRVRKQFRGCPALRASYSHTDCPIGALM